MSSSWEYWIFAWSLMGVAFLTAAIAIIVGSRMLDRQVPDHPDAEESSL